MDIVASPTAASPKEAVRFFPPATASAALANQPRGRSPSHVTPLDESTNTPGPSTPDRPARGKQLTSPDYDTPLRHHRRTPSAARHVKESLNARSEYVTSKDDGAAEHRINQYIIKQEIGRGSFGAVHLAVDQYGQEYAVKEFSKARLRKRAQSNILRQPLAQRRRGLLQGFNSPLHRYTGPDGDVQRNSTDLIKEEIAIMKKLNHPNLVSLIEVLDDPTEDSMYMVMEMCKKGVVMRVGLDERADPYPDHVCRYWFRDLLLGIEYLHAQGVVHRDIKPDNCLVTEDDVLKVVDFGVSEMFSKDSEMRTAKSAGSPAFLPPELCVARHGDVSGRAADIWSMGVTLYCLKYGRIPFEKTQIIELYEAIKTEDPDLSSEEDEDFRDLITKVLQKDPAKRIKMRELREHPWVTKKGTDMLLSEEENTSDLVEPPTEAEMNAAITDNMRNLMTVVKAVNKFKALVEKNKKRPMNSILGEQEDSRFSLPPGRIQQGGASLPPKLPASHASEWNRVTSEDVDPKLDKAHLRPVPTLSIDDTTKTEGENTQKVEQASGHPSLVLSPSSTDTEDSIARVSTGLGDIETVEAHKLPPFRSRRTHANTTDELGHRGHAHDPLEDQLFLHIGPSTFSGSSPSAGEDGTFVSDDENTPIVSESPGAADVDIYETAYRDEIERIMARAAAEKRDSHVYLTRRVDAKLMAMSGLAGKWAAKGEEAKNQIKDYTQFSARKARVTEVSRALRQAAREEYERRKQEHRQWIAAEKAERAARLKEEGREEDETSKPTSTPTPVSAAVGGEGGDAQAASPPSPGKSSVWRGKAVDAGRQARTSFKGFVGHIKQKSRTQSKDDAG